MPFTQYYLMCIGLEKTHNFVTTTIAQQCLETSLTSWTLYQAKIQYQIIG